MEFTLSTKAARADLTQRLAAFAAEVDATGRSEGFQAVLHTLARFWMG